MINLALADERDISQKNIENIQKLQDAVKGLEWRIENSDYTNIRHEFWDWLELHNELQSLWGFEKDDNYIKFWAFPLCSCPRLDNEERYPFGTYVYSGSCKVHGKTVESNLEE